MMKIIAAKDYQDLSRKAANLIAAQVILKPDSVLGLATGSSPIGAYEALIRRCRDGDLDFSRCRTVNLDEYAGLSPQNEQSYSWFMHHHLFDHINIPPEHINIPRGDSPDADAECARYDRVIRDLGGIDLQLLGIGQNGHIAFNEPDDFFEKDTHLVKLADSTIAANSRFFGPGEAVPTHAYTMGIRSIMGAGRILLIANGGGKAEILREMICGPITPRVPASALQLHPNVTVAADREALSLIPPKLMEAFI